MDPVLPTPSVQVVSPSFSKRKQWSADIADTKVKGFVLEKIGEGPRGALLPTAAAPRVMLDLLAALTLPPLVPAPRRKRQQRLRRTSRNRPPIGLRRCRPYEWINAWIQFLLFLPSMPELISFLSRSFDPFREFAEQYAWDQSENRIVSSASSAALVRCLRQMLPIFPEDLYELLSLFTQTAFPYPFSNLVLFRPEWHLVLNEKGPIFNGSPPELLIAIKGEQCFLKKQMGNGSWYDLDAFIEKRPDGFYEPSYIAYLKVEGTWYQCDDERVTPLLSTMLPIPLSNAVLLHYKKLSF